MGYELVPRGDVSLSPSAVAAKLEGAFAIVRVDAQEGRRRAIALAARLESMGVRSIGKLVLDGPKRAAWLRALPADEALVVQFGDEEHHLLQVLLIPGDHLMFGFDGPESESAAKPLIERCARALNAEVVLV
jgi:hypothetical protein